METKTKNAPAEVRTAGKAGAEPEFAMVKDRTTFKYYIPEIEAFLERSGWKHDFNRVGGTYFHPPKESEQNYFDELIKNISKSRVSKGNISRSPTFNSLERCSISTGSRSTCRSRINMNQHSRLISHYDLWKMGVQIADCYQVTIFHEASEELGHHTEFPDIDHQQWKSELLTLWNGNINRLQAALGEHLAHESASRPSQSIHFRIQQPELSDDKPQYVYGEVEDGKWLPIKQQDGAEEWGD